MKTFLTNVCSVRFWIIGWCFAVLMGISQEGWSQKNWTLEFRPGANFPASDLNSNTPLKTGLGVEGIISYNFIPNFGIYAGWGWNKFSSDQSFAGANMDFEGRGYTYGLQYYIPISLTGETKVFFRSGGLWNHIVMKNMEREKVGNTGYGLGWQFETGITVPFIYQWKIQPSISYRSLSREFPFGNSSVEANLNYITLGLGVLWSF